MAELPLDEAVARFHGNEERINKFVNAPGGEESFETSGGERVPVLPKMVELLTVQADRAATASESAVAKADVRTSIEQGLLLSIEGEQFQVLDAGGLSYTRYEHKVIEGVPTAEIVADGFPSAKSVRDLAYKTRWTESGGFEVSDEAGFVGLRYTNENGIETPDFHAKPGELSVGGLMSVTRQPISRNEAMLLVDEFGFCGFSSDLTPQAARETGTDIAARDMANADYVGALRSDMNAETAPLAYDYNIVLMYGQSLSNGFEGWPALTVDALEPGNILMIGESPRPNTSHGAWAPVGAAEWSDLVEVVQDTANPGVILTDAQVAELAPGSPNLGETGGAAALHFWRQMQLGFRGKLSDPERKLVLVNCGCGGRTVEQLSKGASPELYARITDALAAAKTLADGESKTIGLVAVIYAQGEYNYRADLGGTTDKDTFKALTLQLFDDIYTDTQTILGPQKPPAFITYQTGESYSRDNTKLSIGMAQLEMSKERGNVYLAAPNYHVFDKSGHLSANGYRWLGHHYAAALHAVVDRRKNWFPLQPIRAQQKGKTIYVDFAVPVPPLVVRPIYDGANPIVRSDLGLKITDENGDVSIESAAIVGASVVKIELADEPTGLTDVWYAPQSAGGNGNLFDSNQLKALYNFEYNAGSGQYPSEDISELVDKPYPLNNPCVAFCITTEQI